MTNDALRERELKQAGEIVYGWKKVACFYDPILCELEELAKRIAAALAAARENGEARADEHYKTVNGIFAAGRRAGIEEAANFVEDPDFKISSILADEIRALAREPQKKEKP